MLRGIFTETGPVQAFLTRVTAARKVDLLTSRSLFFSLRVWSWRGEFKEAAGSLFPLVWTRNVN